MIYGAPFSIAPIFRPRTPRAESIEGFFSLAECRQIVETARQLPPVPATVSTEHVNDERIRKSDLRWLMFDTPGMDWVFRKLVEGAMALNMRHWQYDLSILYSIQFTEYQAPAAHYGFHQDLGDQNMSTRKLSATVQLSQPSDYDGGQFEVFGGPPIPNLVGTLTAFPSYEQHRVMPVTRGTRYSLVAWLCGPAFR